MGKFFFYDKRSHNIAGWKPSFMAECKLTAPLSYFPLTTLNVTLCVFNSFADIISTINALLTMLQGLRHTYKY